MRISDWSSDVCSSESQDMPDAAIATCATHIQQADALFNPSAVKVVCTLAGRALYFSRAPIPWTSDALSDDSRRLAPGLPALRHIVLYSYRASLLKQFPTMPMGPLEHFLSLDPIHIRQTP